MLHRIPQYFECARANEDIFREILRDIKKGVGIVPKDFDPEEDLDKILKKYSLLDQSERHGRFTIFDFRIGPYEYPSYESLSSLISELSISEAMIGFEDVAFLSGSGALLKYAIQEDRSVKFKETIMHWRK